MFKVKGVLILPTHATVVVGYPKESKQGCPVVNTRNTDVEWGARDTLERSFTESTDKTREGILCIKSELRREDVQT